MPGDYLDTSALAKHYHSEAGSAEVDRLWAEAGRDLFISRLAVLELVSVFAAKVRAGVISRADFDVLRRRFIADLTKVRRPFTTRLLIRHFQEADRLLRERAPVCRLRTLDALQLAVALDLRQHRAIDRLVSSDKDMLVVASLEGLAIFDPENP